MYQSGLGPKILTGEKVTTIRTFTTNKEGGPAGGAKCKPGDILSHREWEGRPYWSKQRELCKTICKEVLPLSIGLDGLMYSGTTRLDGEAISKSDGFEYLDVMLDYFRKTHGLPFFGEITRWDFSSIVPPPAGQAAASALRK
jgi:hypothetical protein